MNPESIWLRGSRARILNESSDTGDLDIGFDPKIPHETETELRQGRIIKSMAAEGLSNKEIISEHIGSNHLIDGGRSAMTRG